MDDFRGGIVGGGGLGRETGCGAGAGAVVVVISAVAAAVVSIAVAAVGGIAAVAAVGAIWLSVCLASGTGWRVVERPAFGSLASMFEPGVSEAASMLWCG